MQKSVKARQADPPSGRRGMSLTTRLSLLVVLLVAGIIAALTYFNLQAVQTSQNQNVQANLSQRAYNLSQLVGSSLETHINELVSLSLNSAIINSIKERNAGYKGTSAEIINGIQQLDARWRKAPDSDGLIVKTLSRDAAGGAALGAFLKAFPVQSEVFITDKYGATIASTGRLSDYYQADEGWWQSAWNSGLGNTFVGEPEYDPSVKITAVNIAIPVRDLATNQVIGVLRSTLNIDDLVLTLTSAKLGVTGYAELYSAEGKALLAGRSEQSNKSGTGKLSGEVLRKLTAPSIGYFIAKGEQGQGVVFAHAPVQLRDGRTDKSSLGWFLTFRQDSTEAFATSATIARNSVLIGVIALVVAVLLALLVAGSISAPIRRLAALSVRVGQGDLSQTANVKNRDEIGALAGSFNEAIVRLRGMIQTEQERDQERHQRQQLQSNVSEFLGVAMDIAQGDFTKRGRVTEDVLGNVVDAINLMVEELALLLKEVQATASQVNSGSVQMEEVSTSIFKRTQEQADAVQRVRQQTEKVAESIQAMAAQANTSAQAAQQTLAASAKGQEALSNTLSGMQSIRREVQNISKSIKGLSERSAEISEVVETIDSIAKQTNLLALNASLEAAGAGEAGARFAVVARQVRKLAEDTAKSAQRVSLLVKGIQTEVQGVSLSIEGGSKEVEQGYRIASEASERLREISTLANQTTELARQMSQVAQAQAGEVVSVGQSVQGIAQVSEETEMQSQYGRQAAGELSLLSEQLRSSLQRFRLPE